MSNKRGIIRKIDELGRVVIPIEMRKVFDIQCKDPVEIYAENNSIILKKHVDSCFLCGSQKDLKDIDEKLICNKCINKISDLT